MKPILFFYILYTVYTFFILSVSNYNALYAIVGLIVLWAIYACLWLGKLSVKKKVEQACEKKTETKFLFGNIAKWKTRTYCIVLLAAFLSTIFAAQFYTGRNVFEVIAGMFSGESAYAIYQKHMKEANIAAFSIVKIPFISMLAFLAIILMWSIVGLMLSDEKLRKSQVLYLIGIVCCYLYFGMARGTNFEMYFVFILFVYCLIRKINFKNWKTDKKKILIFLGVVLGLCLAAVFIFRWVLTERGVHFQNIICPEILFNKDSFLGKYFPEITNIGISVFSYLGYGIFTMGVTFTEIIFSSANSFLCTLIPFGHTIFNGVSLETQIRSTLNLASRWVADSLVFIDYFGILLFFAILFFVGRYAELISRKVHSNLLKELLNVIIYIEMLSLPVGNFIVSNSSLCITAAVVLGSCLFPFAKELVCKLKNKKKTDHSNTDTI